ncbi:MAG TPA: GAF domain-containing protein [Candidatus Acidoferrales bacterium]|nr:GAF domain-containing protein [Candidatus Acidoferrales bacterium]
MASLFRFVLVAFNLATLVFAVIGLTAPIRQPAGQFRTDALAGGRALVSTVVPGSAAQRAGLGAGDIIDNSTTPWRVYFERRMARVGQTIALPIIRGGERRTITYTVDKPAPNPLDRSWLGLAVVLIGVGTSLLVGLRCAERSDGRLLSLFLGAVAQATAGLWFLAVCDSPLSAYIWRCYGILVVTTFLNYGLVMLGTSFPPVTSRLRAALRHTALPLALIAAGLFMALDFETYFDPAALFASLSINHLPVILFITQIVADVFIPAVTILGCLIGLARVDAEHRAQMNWVAAALVMTQGAWLVQTMALLIAPTHPLPGSDWLALFLNIPLLVILPYVILRHRLVDLSIVVSRAAIFASVSLIVVSAFILGEWFIGNLAQRFVPGTGRDLAGQAMLLVLALAIGLSAQRIHAQVDRRLNGVFFAKRARSLANLRRFSQETDVVVKGPSLLKLFYDTVVENTEATYAAIYLRDGGTFVLTHGSKNDLPQGLDEDDPAVVKLRRWNEAFENERSSHPLSEALVIPMMVHGTLFGILVCGPKKERTHFAGEEVDALAHAAHRTGIAHLFLSNQMLSGRPLVAPL